jgi:outer membrane protein OmpA-like peptidoglycan-associated protein/uncharacterized surface protein with fasciclin (FAS1) repeats
MSRPRPHALRYRRRILAVGLGAALLVFCIGFPIVNKRIESDLERRVPEELAAAGFGGVTASFSGQDGTLDCVAPLADPEAATAAAYDVWGVRTITLDRDCRVNRAPVVEDESASDTASAESSAESAATTAALGDFATIADAVAGSPDLSYLAVLVGESGLGDQLADPAADPVTVFAPTDAAFEALPADVNAQLRADPALLAEVLGAHIVSGAVRSTDLAAGPLTTMDGSTLDVTITDGTIAVDGARVVAPDLVTGNGIVHVIEQVLLPDGFEAVSQRPRAATQAAFDAGTLTFDGVVASEVERQTLLDVATGAVGDGNVVDRMTADPETGLDRDNAAALAILIGEMTANLTSGTAGFDGTALYVSGTYADDAARDAMTAAAVTVGAVANLEPPPAGATAEAEQLETELNEAVAAEPIRFEVNSAVLTDEAGAVLDDLASQLGDATGFAVTVEGHTDSDGDAAANLALSQRRAEAVVAALVERGVAAGALTAEGFGETLPVLVAGVEDKDASRRVEFRIEALG